MSHESHEYDEEEPGWTPKGATATFNGFSVRDHGVWATDVNHGNQEPEDDE